jgi:hypothetical protein
VNYINGFVDRNTDELFFDCHSIAFTHPPFQPAPDSEEWLDATKWHKIQIKHFLI